MASCLGSHEPASRRPGGGRAEQVSWRAWDGRTLTIDDAEEVGPLAGHGERDAGQIPRLSISPAAARPHGRNCARTPGLQSHSHNAQHANKRSAAWIPVGVRVAGRLLGNEKIRVPCAVAWEQAKHARGRAGDAQAGFWHWPALGSRTTFDSLVGVPAGGRARARGRLREHRLTIFGPYSSTLGVLAVGNRNELRHLESA